MKTTKITRQKVYEVIAQQIKQQIMSGDLKPGDRLPTVRNYVGCMEWEDRR